MEKKGQNFKKEEPFSKIVSKENYVDSAWSYALSMGYISEKEKNRHVNNFLNPVYAKYEEILADLGQEKDINPANRDGIIRKLNFCLEATKRAGSTNSSNILKTIDSYRRPMFADDYIDIFTEYSITSFYDFIGELLHKLYGQSG